MSSLRAWIVGGLLVIAASLGPWSMVVTMRDADDLRGVVHALEREGNERRDQTCIIFESQQQQRITTLQKTYDYLSGLTRRQRADPLNQALLNQLAEREQEARTKVAPPYCDEPRVGLPEPDPPVPPRPAGLTP